MEESSGTGLLWLPGWCLGKGRDYNSYAQSGWRWLDDDGGGGGGASTLSEISDSASSAT